MLFPAAKKGHAPSAGVDFIKFVRLASGAILTAKVNHQGDVSVGCAALQVLYGHNCLLQDDFAPDQIMTAASPNGIAIGRARKLKQEQMLVYNSVQAKIEQYAAQLIGQKYLVGIQRWRKRAEAALLRKRKAL